MHEWLDRFPVPQRAVVVGGGYVGVEMAEALVRRGLAVTLLEKAKEPMPTVLSGGQWQRIALSRALMRGVSDLLVLDEPSAGLDAVASTRCNTGCGSIAAAAPACSSRTGSAPFATPTGSRSWPKVS